MHYCVNRYKIFAIFEKIFYYDCMRIISGKYRGKNLKEFNIDTTKPTTDRVKESIFNLIQFDVVDAVVLDLFSGTGALGIECISRGSKQVHFVDLNKQAISLIKENLKGIDGEYQVFNQSYEEFLKNTQMRYDIIFLDPPYKTDYGVKAIKMIIENNLLNDKGIIIFETSGENNFDLNFKNFSLKTKKYGTVIVHKLVKDEV